jgi:hypothetical protein
MLTMTEYLEKIPLHKFLRLHSSKCYHGINRVVCIYTAYHGYFNEKMTIYNVNAFDNHL